MGAPCSSASTGRGLKQRWLRALLRTDRIAHTVEVLLCQLIVRVEEEQPLARRKFRRSIARRADLKLGSWCTITSCAPWPSVEGSARVFAISRQ